LERRTILVLITILAVLAFFLLYTVISQSMQGPPGPGPSVATDVGLLITVVLCVSISLWATFADKEAKNWIGKALFVFGLICSSVLFWFLSWLPVGLIGPYQGYPAAFDNVSTAGHFMLLLALILGLAAILAFILTLDNVLILYETPSVQQNLGP
jgi:hypothetical protein